MVLGPVLIRNPNIGPAEELRGSDGSYRSDHTGFDADTDSAAHTDDTFHNDFDASEMQRLAISPASSYPDVLFSPSPLRSVFPFNDFSSSLGGCPPPTDDGRLAETGLKRAEHEHDEIDSFGRSLHQREWTRHYVPVDEYDSDGDLMPDGTFDERNIGDLADPLVLF